MGHSANPRAVQVGRSASRRARSLRKDRGRCGFEPLELRRLFAAVAWTGAGDGVNWTNTANWSGNALPTAADDVTINVAANPNIVLASGTQSIHSLNLAENLSVNGGSLGVATTASSTVNVGVSGGTVLGGTWSFGAGGGFNIGTTGGSVLNGVSTTGDLFFATDNAHAVMSGNTTFGTAHLSNNSTSIGFAPGFTLSSNVLFEGAATGRRDLEMNGGTGSLTIGATGSIKTAAGFAGSVNIGSSFWFGGAMTLNNGGLISSETNGRTISIISANFANTGTTQATNSGTIVLAPANSYANGGTFNVNGGTVNGQGKRKTTRGLGTGTNTPRTINLLG